MSKEKLGAEKDSCRNYGLDFLKIIATIIIVFHHYQQALNVVYPTGINYFNGSFYFGRMVELFFIISGYVMHRYIDIIYTGRITLKDWYIKRALRLLPLVAISAVLFECATKVHNMVCFFDNCVPYQEIDLFGTITTGLGMQIGVAFRNPMINNPTWYVSVLILVYVIFYIVTALAKKLQVPPYYLYIFMVLFGCGIKTYGINTVFFNPGTYRGIYCFFTGILLAQYVYNFGVTKKTALVCSGIVLTMIPIIAFKMYLLSSEVEFALSFLLFPALILLTETTTSKKIFRHDIWKLLGQFSYGVYIWHSVLIMAMLSVTHILDIKPNYAQRKNMYLFCLICQVAGIISYYRIEKPLDRYLKKKLRGITGNN